MAHHRSHHRRRHVFTTILKLVSANMLRVVHCGATRAVGMHDAHHIVFLDAETLQQLAECSVLPPDFDSCRGAVSIQSMLWSEHGTMLAVGSHTGRSPASNRSASSSPTGDTSDWISNIRIYSTLSGQCLQSALLQAANAAVSWSSSLALLLVDCARFSSFPRADDGVDGADWLDDHALDRPPRVSRLQSCRCYEWIPGEDLFISKCWDHTT